MLQNPRVLLQVKQSRNQPTETAMFDISFAELFLISVIALLILGPQRLPEVLRTVGLWMGRMRRVYNNVRQEIDREVGMDDIRRQLHNEQITAELKQVEAEAKALKRDISGSVADAIREGEAENNEVKDSPSPKPESDENSARE